MFIKITQTSFDNESAIFLDFIEKTLFQMYPGQQTKLFLAEREEPNVKII